jgi:D-alanine-D-alanine ligase-like ATP-grasp enzyme
MTKASLRIALVYTAVADFIDQGLSVEDLAEFDVEETLVSIETSLQTIGHHTLRVGNLFHLTSALADGAHHSWDLVFNIAEGQHGSAREAQVPALLEGYKIPCTFSDAKTLAVVHDKALTKIVLRHHGIQTAAWTTVSPSEDFSVGLDEQAWCERLGLGKARAFPELFVKPNSEGSSKGIDELSHATSAAAANDAVRRLQTRFPDQDALIETYLNGRELTVSIVGTGAAAEVIGVLELLWLPSVKTGRYGSYHAKMIAVEGELWTEKVVFPENDAEVAAAADLALRAWRALGCRDAGRVDTRSRGWGALAVPHVTEVRTLLIKAGDRVE